MVSNIAHNDSLGRLTAIQSGSLQNLICPWDHLGNLMYRHNGVQGASESFGYEILNRLRQAQVTNSGGVQPAVTYASDALGDIASKSDTGSYT